MENLFFKLFAYINNKQQEVIEKESAAWRKGIAFSFKSDDAHSIVELTTYDAYQNKFAGGWILGER